MFLMMEIVAFFSACTFLLFINGAQLVYTFPLYINGGDQCVLKLVLHFVCMCVCMYVCPLISAATHIGITKQIYIPTDSSQYRDRF